VTKLLRDEIKMVEAVEMMSRRIEELEKNEQRLHGYITKQLDRIEKLEHDNNDLIEKSKDNQ